MSKKLMAKLRKLEGAITHGEYDPYDNENCLHSPSPSMNWAFGHKGHGLPFGYGLMLYGPPKGGKSIISLAMAGWLHRNDPDSIVIFFNTELRGELQANTDSLKVWGIDPDRFITFDVNEPALVFDRIKNDVTALIQEGLKVKMIVIDSLSGIVGRRTMNQKTIDQHQIGDHAQTIKLGLEMILPTLRRNKIALIATTHVRAEMDMLQQMRGKKVKAQAAWATQHILEFFAYVERNESKTGRQSLNGEDFIEDGVKDFMGKADVTGHKIRFRIDDSSKGIRGRVAEFTLNFQKGIVNQHEEIFRLGLELGVISKPNNVMYKYGDQQWRGVGAILKALKEDYALANEILVEVMEKDRKYIEGEIEEPSSVSEKEVEA